MKKVLLLVLLSLPLYGKVIEIPFIQQNKEDFFLINCQIKNQRVEMAEGDALYFKSFNSVFIPFEGSSQKNPQQNISFFHDAIFGKTSGLFYESKNFMRFTFENSFNLGMVLEFWLKPFSVESGTIISTEHLSPDGINRQIEAYFKSGKLYFVFENLFIDSSVPPKPKTLIISSEKILPVKEWHHHRIIYNPTNGELNYYLDNHLVSQVWATENGLPDATLMYLEAPQKWDYVLGKGYRGLMDNFFLTADMNNNFSLSIYDKQKGIIQSRVIKLPSLASIYDMEIDHFLFKDTALTLQYRISLTPFSERTSENLIPWEDYNIESPQFNKKMKGNYVQFRVTLYPSPDGQHSPLVKSMRIKYDTLEIPAIPLGVTLSSSQSQITLSFRESLNKNIKGYKAYYGLEQENYWGKDALEGSSPVFIPISQLESSKKDGRLFYTFQDMQSNQVYYMRITAISDDNLESEMSEEVSVRVRKLK